MIYFCKFYSIYMLYLCMHFSLIQKQAFFEYKLLGIIFVKAQFLL